jgi:hypothetical protein
MLRHRLSVILSLFVGLGLAAGPAAAATPVEIWNLEAVDALGNGTSPYVYANPDSTAAWVTFQGIVLNKPSDMLSVSNWQMYVQALPGSPYPNAGIALYANKYYNATGWPRYSNDWLPGDRVTVTGIVGFYNGKTNLNERHDGDYRFTVQLDSPGSLPAPRLIPSIAQAIAFDPTRATGGENYQAQWCQLNGASVVSGTWGANKTVMITDSSGAQMAMILGLGGGFTQGAAPPGRFNITAIFDQEDPTGATYNTNPPYEYLGGGWTGDYRFWPLSCGQLALWGDANSDGVVNQYDSEILAAHNGMTTGATWALGDFNGDGAVNGIDSDALSLNYGYSTPEPATLGLLALGGLGVAVIRRRSRRAATAALDRMA